MPHNLKRCPPRFRDGDCPDDVADILNHSQYGDRYTVIFRGIHSGDWVTYLSMSENPSHPQGIGMHGEFRLYEARAYRDANRRRRVKWTDLPEKVRAYVKRSCE